MVCEALEKIVARCSLRVTRGRHLSTVVRSAMISREYAGMTQAHMSIPRQNHRTCVMHCGQSIDRRDEIWDIEGI